MNIHELKPEYITDEHGNKKAVIISIADFQELLEDIGDLAVVAERRDEPTVTHNELLEELKTDGLL